MEQSTQGDDTQTMTPAPVGERVVTSPQPPVAFTKVDNNLTGIGFFSASNKRSRKAVEKTTVITDDGIEHRISILPSAKYGLPITQDQDYWFALMKLASEYVQQQGKLTNPFTFTTAQVLRILGHQTHNGKNYKAVDEWLSVMAFTGIEGGAYNAAKKQWLTKRTHAIESTVTIGKELPDGSIADKNHIWFSQWQLDNINAGNLIPIELATYTQLENNISKNLVPHLQEWLYASQRDGRFEKQYEDICQLLGIRVYRYRSQIAEQLSPSLTELVHHAYISKWAIEPMANRKTYKLMLWHGSKYHRDQQHRVEGKQRARISSAAKEAAPTTHRPRQRHLNLKAAAPEAPVEQPSSHAIIDYRLIAELTKRGISETDARTILASLPASQAVLNQLEWADLQISQSRGKIQNPAGFYISLLQRNIIPPSTFETSSQRSTRLAANLAQQEALQIETQAEQEAHEAAEAELDRFKDTNPEQYQALYSQVQAQLYAEHPKIADFARSHPGSSMHEGAIRSRMRQLIAEGTHQNQATFASAPEVILELSENPQQATNSASSQDSRLEEITARETLFAGMLQAWLLTLQIKAPNELPPAPTSPTHPKSKNILSEAGHKP